MKVSLCFVTQMFRQCLFLDTLCMFTVLDGNSADEEALSVSKVMQWLSGQAHRHLLLSERQAFKITVLFDHTCMARMPEHKICYPVVSACTHTITIPTAHFASLNEFKENMKIAVQQGACFYRV